MITQQPCCNRRFQTKPSGFTLVEVLASLFLMGIFIAIFGMGIVAAVQSYDFSRTNVHIAQKSQLSMSRMSRELMELTDILGESGTENDTYIIYDRMVQSDPDTPPELMRFAIHHHLLEDSTGVIKLYTDLDDDVTSLDSISRDDGDILIDNVDAFALEYHQDLDTTWSLLSGNIQRLSAITLNMTLARPDRSGKTQTFKNIIHLRNNDNRGGQLPTTTPVSIDDYNCFIRTLFRGLCL